MATILSKVRIAVLSNVHALLDKAIDLNSAEAVKQHARDLEAALEELQNEAAVARGRVRTLTREKAELDGKTQELNRSINTILTDSNPDNDHLAASMEARLVALEKRQAEKDMDITDANRTSLELDEAVAQVQAKYTAIVEDIRRLESMERSAKAKESAAKAVRAAGRLTSGGAEISVDNVASRIQGRKDVADERFTRAMGDMQVTNGVADAEVEDRLAKRKALLAEAAAKSAEPVAQ